MRTIAISLACCALLTPALDAQTRATVQTQIRSAAIDAPNFRRVKVPGEEVARNIKRLTTEMRWHKTLASARSAARQSGKPVLWIQALGDLKGFL